MVNISNQIGYTQNTQNINKLLDALDMYKNVVLIMKKEGYNSEDFKQLTKSNKPILV